MNSLGAGHVQSDDPFVGAHGVVCSGNYATWDEALAAYERAMAIDPRLPRLANNIELARAALDADLPRRMAGELDPQYAARLNDAGVVAAASGQVKRAEAAFARAIELRSRWFGRAADNLAALGAPK